MKKEHLLLILLFGTIWGASEAIFGGALYRVNAAYASVPLTIIALIVLTVARVYFPQAGSSTLIASCALLYKFLNVPFFACHLLAIFLIGASYDLVRSRFKIKNEALFAITATYLAYASFALMITYVFQYSFWVQGGLPKVLQYIGIEGTMAALANAVLVPLTIRFTRQLKAKSVEPVLFRSRLALGGSSLVVAALWILCATVSF